MKLVKKLLTNDAYGFPRGSKKRRAAAQVFVIHITGNAKNLGPDAAKNERDYANRSNGSGPSATYYVNRPDAKGEVEVIQALELAWAPWTNGDLHNPQVSKPGWTKYIGPVLRRGLNANEPCVTFECVGGTGSPVTNEQLDAVADVIAEAAKTLNITKIVPWENLMPHAVFDSETRASCFAPPSKQDGALARVAARANAGLNPAPAPAPALHGTTQSAAVDATTTILKARIAALEAALAACRCGKVGR